MQPYHHAGTSVCKSQIYPTPSLLASAMAYDQKTIRSLMPRQCAQWPLAQNPNHCLHYERPSKSNRKEEIDIKPGGFCTGEPICRHSVRPRRLPVAEDITYTGNKAKRGEKLFLQRKPLDATNTSILQYQLPPSQSTPCLRLVTSTTLQLVERTRKW